MNNHIFLLAFDRFSELSTKLIFPFGNSSNLSSYGTEHRDGDWSPREGRFWQTPLGRDSCPDL